MNRRPRRPTRSRTSVARNRHPTEPRKPRSCYAVAVAVLAILGHAGRAPSPFLSLEPPSPSRRPGFRRRPSHHLLLVMAEQIVSMYREVRPRTDRDHGRNQPSPRRSCSPRFRPGRICRPTGDEHGRDEPARRPARCIADVPRERRCRREVRLRRAHARRESVLGTGYVLTAFLAVGVISAYPTALLGVILVLIAFQLGWTGVSSTDDLAVVAAIGVVGVLVNLASRSSSASSSSNCVPDCTQRLAATRL